MSVDDEGDEVLDPHPAVDQAVICQAHAFQLASGRLLAQTPANMSYAARVTACLIVFKRILMLCGCRVPCPPRYFTIIADVAFTSTAT